MEKKDLQYIFTSHKVKKLFPRDDGGACCPICGKFCKKSKDFKSCFDKCRRRTYAPWDWDTCAPCGYRHFSMRSMDEHESTKCHRDNVIRKEDYDMAKLFEEIHYLRLCGMEIAEIVLDDTVLWSISVENLTYLDIKANEIVDISPICETFINLEYLDASFNYIETVPPSIKYLEKLKHLDVSNNFIRSISTGIKNCLSLEVLLLENNVLEAVPSEIAELYNLSVLTLHCFKIDAPVCLNLQKQELSEDIDLMFSYFLKIRRESNPEADMAELMAYQIEFIDCVKKILEENNSNMIEWRRMKVLVVGQENVGKTHLVTGLNPVKKGAKYQNISTDGIAIDEMYFSDKDRVHFKVFDFGGQEVFYPTHQFFLSNRSIYIVVFKVTTMNFENVEYWLKTIKTVAGFNSPVVIVATHVDQENPDYIRELEEKIVNEISCMYGADKVKEIILISNTKGRGNQSVGYVKQVVQNIASNHFIVKKKVPQIYDNVSKILNLKRSQGVKYIFWKDYIQLSFVESVAESPVKIETMTEFFHDMGEIVWFKDADLMESLIILEPEWLQEIMTTIVSFKTNWKDGIIDNEKLRAFAWKGYPQEIHDQLYQILNRFDILFPVAGEFKDKLSLIPCMFDNEPSPGFLAKEKLYFSSSTIGLINGVKLARIERRYEFKFLPMGFFSRIIVRILQDVINKSLPSNYWKYGIEINKGDQAALIQYFPRDCILNVVVVYTEKKKADSEDLFPLLISVIDSTLDTLFVNDVRRYAICPHCFKTYIDIENAQEFVYEDLVDMFTKGTTHVYCKHGNIPVHLVDIAPDVCLRHIPIVTYKIVNRKKIGEGGFGIVFKGLMLGPNGREDVAIKELKVSKDVMDLYREFNHEVFIMSKLDHPCLVKLFGITLNPLAMVLEFCPANSLSYHLYRNHDFEFSLRYKLKIVLDIARGLDFLHNEITPPIIHRDLRSPNIFMYSVNSIDPIVAKVGDFGLSQHAAPKLSEMLKTWQWLAPEVIDSADPQYDESSDTYSFGIIVYEVFSRLLPFSEYTEYLITKTEDLTEEQLNDESLMKIFENGGWIIDVENSMAICEEWNVIKVKDEIIERGLRPTIPKDIPEQLAEIMRRCWLQNPRERPNLPDVVEQLYQMCEEYGAYAPKVSGSNVHKNLNTSKANTERLLLFYRRRYTSEVKLIGGVTSISNRRLWLYNIQSEILILDKRKVVKTEEMSGITKLLSLGKWVAYGRIDGEILIMDVGTLAVIKRIKSHSSPVTQLILGVVGTIYCIASADSTGNIKVYNANNFELLKEIQRNGEVNSMCFFKTHIYIAHLNSILIYNMDNDDVFEMNPGPVSNIVAGKSVYYSIGNSIFILDNENNVIYSNSTHFEEIIILCPIVYGREYHIWSSSEDNTVLVYDKDGKILQELNGFDSPVISISQVDKETIETVTEYNVFQWKYNLDNIVEEELIDPDLWKNAFPLSKRVKKTHFGSRTGNATKKSVFGLQTMSTYRTEPGKGGIGIGALNLNTMSQSFTCYDEDISSRQKRLLRSAFIDLDMFRFLEYRGQRIYYKTSTLAILDDCIVGGTMFYPYDKERRYSFPRERHTTKKNLYSQLGFYWHFREFDFENILNGAHLTREGCQVRVCIIKLYSGPHYHPLCFDSENEARAFCVIFVRVIKTWKRWVEEGVYEYFHGVQSLAAFNKQLGFGDHDMI
eukprot:TRINITY_DN7505_c0_g1_i1.p1 TRINITY_DN7505_c0_g1~~TRINITY_DN7505_c0_g1_i1.p1  ORF type:complete len:1687 (-),score=329.77 TRINITY_DN7505_c0_g1_i1:29-5089(-)